MKFRNNLEYYIILKVRRVVIFRLILIVLIVGNILYFDLGDGYVVVYICKIN